MRKYYDIYQESKFNPDTRLANAQALPWMLFATLLQGYPSNWRKSMRKRLFSIIETRNIELLLDCQKELDSYTKTYNETTSTQTVVCDRRALAFLKKYPFKKKQGFDTQANAIVKWKDAEDQCRATNERLRPLADAIDENNHALKATIPDWVFQARDLIRDCLPDLTPELITQMGVEGEHGPGATLTNDTEKGRVTQYYKYADFPYSVTLTAQRYALSAITSNHNWINVLENSGRRTTIPVAGTPLYQKQMQIFCDCTEQVVADRITFVPKDIFTDRPIAISASLNMFLQLGVKATLEKALKQVGVDLTDQSKNQQYAYLGSRDAFNGDGTDNQYQFSTIDLASASDTISFEIVRLLLPPEWFCYLCDLRHEFGELGEDLVKYEKFSAMGNGFTFPLESLIFWAVAKATLEDQGFPSTERDIAVYGDDIIVRYIGAPAVCANLGWCGFLINHEKSFLRGGFKESCGADFFRGQNVRPFYLKQRVLTYRTLYHLANSLQDVCVAQKNYSGYARVYTQSVALIPKGHRNYVPPSLGVQDSGLSVPLSYMKERGVFPILDFDEYTDYVKRGYISTDLTWNTSMMFARVSPMVPCTYKGRLLIRKMLCLKKRTKPTHSHMSVEELLHLQAAASGKITRKGKIASNATMVSILDWDGPESSCVTSTRHLVWCVLV